MQLNIIPNLSSPSLIDTELQTPFIQEQSPINNRISFQLNFDTCSTNHKDTETEQIYKSDGCSVEYTNGGKFALSSIG
jgi:hypothetical protein